MRKNKLLFRRVFRHYIETMEGALLIISNDNYFTRITKYCFKASGLKERSFYSTRSFVHLSGMVQRLLTQHKHVTVLIERHLEGKSTIDDIAPIQKQFRSKIKVLVISTETDHNTIALFREKGADGVIIKPVSTNTIIEIIGSTLSPNNRLDELIDSCETALLFNDTHEAEALAGQILQIRSNSATGLMLMGDIRLQNDDLDKAEYYYTKAVLSSKTNLDPLKRLVNYYDRCNKIRKKIIYLKKLDKLSPLNRDRKLEIANSYITIGDRDAAYVYFDQAITLAKREANAILSKTYMDISISLRSVDIEKSLKFNTLAIHVKRHHLDRDDIWMFNEKGIFLRKNDRNKEAIECFKHAIKLSPDDAAINYNLGMAYAEEKEVKLASDCFDKALAQDKTLVKTNANIPFNIGLTFFNARRFDDAYALFLAASQMEPDNRQIAEMRDTAFKRTTDFDLQ